MALILTVIVEGTMQVLKKDREMYEAFFESAEDYNILKDARLRYVNVNNAMAKLFNK